MNTLPERLALPVVMILLALGLWGMRGSVSEVEVGVVSQATPTSTSATDSWDASPVVVVGDPTVEVGSGVVEIVAVTPEPAPTIASKAPVRPYSRAGFEKVLRTAGWPDEWLAEAYSVSCGPAVLRDGTVVQWGESACRPDVIGEHDDRGLFQITPVWHDRCGVDGPDLMYPLVNAACALIIVRYSESVGLGRWYYWSTDPLGVE